ncbi:MULTISPECIES: LysR substrate-binding domain-containing protein [Lysobacter]|uniref:LysR substrate-binding domain-containing protein n=1 Tax=Lysobacter firmicutimachus TaxID=1792846 RepID=A0ABU8CY31_9GAMM|nr:LysR substrate-binding domain-containing protein [Lysobacter antibioticus]
MFDLARLRLLRDLARLGTMTAVAQAHRLTSSAVSQQLATLQREARAPLFEQVGRRVRLTAEGERLAAHAERILQAVEAAALDLRGAAQSPQGELQVACFASYAKRHLLPAILRLRERHPALRVVVRELEPPDALDAVRDGRCDLAFSFAYSLVPRPVAADLASRTVFEEPVRLALPPSWRRRRGAVELRALAEAEWIVGSRQTDDGLLAERACAAAGFAPRISHTVDDYDLMLRMVAAGLGVGFVPQLALEPSRIDGVAVRTAAGAALSRRVQAATRPALVASPKLRALLAELGAAPIA